MLKSVVVLGMVTCQASLFCLSVAPYATDTPTFINLVPEPNKIAPSPVTGGIGTEFFAYIGGLYRILRIKGFIIENLYITISSPFVPRNKTAVNNVRHIRERK